MPEHRPTWLVTGASGFLGANLGVSLEGRAHRIGVTRPTATPQPTYDEWLDADLSDPETVSRVIAERAPDVVVHAAAVASHEACERDPEQAERVNAAAAGGLARAAAAAGSRFVLISTDAVFDGRTGHYGEDDVPQPFSVYGRTKLDGEHRALEHSGSLVVRTNFFGWSPTGQRSILEFFVNELTAGRAVKGFTDFTVTSAYAQGLCEALQALVDLGAEGLLNVTSHDALTKYDFGVAVAAEFDLDAGLITPTSADVDPPRNRDLSLDVSKVERLLGHRLETQAEGIARARRDAEAIRTLIRI